MAVLREKVAERCAACAKIATKSFCSQFFNRLQASTTGYGDITPRSIAEQVVANLYMIFGVVFAGFLIGMHPCPVHARGEMLRRQPCRPAERCRPA
eukprot:362301-Chlamydomonas_euryale.AAC.2